MRFNSNYLGLVYQVNHFRTTIDRLRPLVRRLKSRAETQFDALAFRGSSGAAAAFPLSLLEGIPLIHVRKRGEQTHGSEIESHGDYNTLRFMIIDDFISTGETINQMLSTLYGKEHNDMRCVGIILYNNLDKRKVWSNHTYNLELKCFSPG